MGLVGVYFGMFQAFPGAIPVQPANEKRCRLIDRQVVQSWCNKSENIRFETNMGIYPLYR